LKLFSIPLLLLAALFVLTGCWSADEVARRREACESRGGQFYGEMDSPHETWADNYECIYPTPTPTPLAPTATLVPTLVPQATATSVASPTATSIPMSQPAPTQLLQQQASPTSAPTAPDVVEPTPTSSSATPASEELMTFTETIDSLLDIYGQPYLFSTDGIAYGYELWVPIRLENVGNFYGIVSVEDNTGKAYQVERFNEYGSFWLTEAVSPGVESLTITYQYEQPH